MKFIDTECSWTAWYLTDTDTLLIVLEQDGTWLTQYLIDAECSLSGQFALSYADDAA